jgi:CheY-like chemotaxis protein
MSKVLLIDDDPIIVAMYKKTFEARGFEVQSAADGEEGYRAIGTFKPDAVLLDLNMPNVSGPEWLRRVRGQPELRDLPVVVLTAGTFASQIRAAKEAGATQVLNKGRLDAGRVAEVIASALATTH